MYTKRILFCTGPDVNYTFFLHLVIGLPKNPPRFWLDKKKTDPMTRFASNFSAAPRGDPIKSYRCHTALGVDTFDGSATANYTGIPSKSTLFQWGKSWKRVIGLRWQPTPTWPDKKKGRPDNPFCTKFFRRPEVRTDKKLSGPSPRLCHGQSHFYILQFYLLRVTY